MRCALLAFLAVPALLAQQSAQITGIGNFIHVVADLDKTMAFYGETLGLERTGAPGPRAYSRNELVENLYDAKGAESRVAGYKIPGSNIGLEFVEFKGISQKPFHPKIDEPGAAILRLARADRSGTIEDPDGFYIQFVKAADGVPPAELAIATRDSRQLIGSLSRYFVVFVDPKVKGSASPAIHDPGAGVLRLVVGDVDANLEALRRAEFPVASAGGQIAVANDRHYVIVRNPEGFFFQLFPAAR